MLHTEFKNNTSYCRRIGLWESLGCFRKDNYLLDNAREERGRRVLTVVFFLQAGGEKTQMFLKVSFR
jgi:hypothetical protein